MQITALLCSCNTEQRSTVDGVGLRHHTRHEITEAVVGQISTQYCSVSRRHYWRCCV